MITKSPNQLPFRTEWERYETPAVVRKHGREFLDRLWLESRAAVNGRPVVDLRRIAESCRGRLHQRAGLTMIFTEDRTEALRCAEIIERFGLASRIEVCGTQITVQPKRPGGAS